MPRAASSQRTRTAATYSYRPPWPAWSPAGAPPADAAGHSARGVADYAAARLTSPSTRPCADRHARGD
jgi:hypothetical protein